MAKPEPCPVPEGLDPLLPGLDFADCFAIEVPKGRFNAASAARLAFGTSPRWVKALLRLRNLVVAPLGLTGSPPALEAGRIGWFPLVSEAPDRVVIGLDDKHLDFRIVVDLVPGEASDRVLASTIIRRHNGLGRAYLATILPFHKAIVPRMLAPLGR